MYSTHTLYNGVFECMSMIHYNIQSLQLNMMLCSLYGLNANDGYYCDFIIVVVYYDYYLTVNYTGPIFVYAYTHIREYESMLTLSKQWIHICCALAHGCVCTCYDKWWCDPIKIRDACFKILCLFTIFCFISFLLCASVKPLSFFFKPFSRSFKPCRFAFVF